VSIKNFLYLYLVKLFGQHGKPITSAFIETYIGSFGMIAGTWITLTGLILVVIGWREIHRARNLVTDGIYKYIRHPQYVGLFLILFGWLLHWPTLLTLKIFGDAHKIITFLEKGNHRNIF
jgi:protein-S-isoprenylcysteine O-methyltransferase Ste14